MRILFIAPRFHSNQISLINKLKEEGHTIDFFVIGKGDSENYEVLTPKNIPISWLTLNYVKYFKKNIDFAIFQKIAIPRLSGYYKMINRFKPDVVIVRGGPEPIYAWPLFRYLFSRTRLIYYTQSPKMVEKVSTLRKIYDYVFSNRYKIKWYTPVCYQPNAKTQLIDLHYMQYLPFFIQPKTLKPVVNDNKELSFLSVAKYEPRKNLDILLDVAIVLLKTYSFKLTIIGSTGTEKRRIHYDKMKLKVDSSGLNSVITLLKDIPFVQMDNYYRSHQIFLMPTSKEPASISQLEAMSYGLAVVCSRDNGTAHYIKDQENGFLIEPTANELKTAVENYLLNPNLVGKHREESLRLVNTDFSIEENYKKFMTLIK